MHAPTITAQEIAELLHFKNFRTFQNKLPKMTAEGFPKHLPGHARLVAPPSHGVARPARPRG